MQQYTIAVEAEDDFSKKRSIMAVFAQVEVALKTETQWTPSPELDKYKDEIRAEQLAHN